MNKAELEKQVEYLMEQNKALIELLTELMTTGIGEEDEIQITIIPTIPTSLTIKKTFRWGGSTVHADDHNPIPLWKGDKLVFHVKVKDFKPKW